MPVTESRAKVSPRRAAHAEPTPALISRWHRNWAPFVFLAALPGVIAMTWSGLPLAWDGASKLLRTLNDRQAYIPHGRESGTILKWPVLLAQAMTNGAAAPRLVYCAVYASVPLLALALSWAIVRRDAPQLMVWPSLGILLVTLPGQAFSDNEALVATQLAWPLLLAVLVGFRSSSSRYIAPVLVVFLLFLHPLAVLGVVLRRLPARIMLPSAAVLAGLGVMRALWRDKFERHQSNLGVLWGSYHGSVAGAPAQALVVVFILSVLLIVGGRQTRVRWLSTGPHLALLLLLPVFWLLPWAANPRSWDNALQFRAWCLVLTLPFVAMAAVDCWAPRRQIDGAVRGDTLEARRLVALAAAVVFSVVLVSQSVAWSSLVGDLQGQLRRTPSCLALDSLTKTRRTALRHWGTSSLAIVLQGRKPTKVVLSNQTECAAYLRGAIPPVVGHGQRLHKDGWIELPTGR